MSEAMIGGGNSLAALNHGVINDYQGDDFPEGEGVMMAKGLGFSRLELSISILSKDPGSVGLWWRS
jgi:hypothetical protein